MPGIGSQPVPKVPAGKLSLRDERERKRFRRLNGAKGPAAEQRATKSRKVQLAERAVKTAAKDLDGWRCRFPDCEVPNGTFWGQIEAAHATGHAEGIGGSPRLERTTVHVLLACCRWHHQGPRSLHSGHVKTELLTKDGTRGPVAWHVLDDTNDAGKWRMAGLTSPPLVTGDEDTV